MSEPDIEIAGEGEEAKSEQESDSKRQSVAASDEHSFEDITDEAV